MEEELEHVIETQRKVVEYQKSKKHSKLHQCLIIADDISDDPRFSRNSKLLHSLYTRGRHLQISTITSVQKFASLHPIIRVNAVEMIIFKLRNYQDLELVLIELGGMFRGGKDLIYDIYDLATKEPHNFLHVNLTSKDPNKMFMINFQKYIRIKDV